MNNSLRTWTLLLSCAVATFAAGSQAYAQAFPSKPVRIVVPYSAGSGSDIVTRIMAEGLQEQLKQPVLVENRDGAGGVVGTQAFLRMPADGYTLLMITNSQLIAAQLTKVQPFEPLKDFVPVARTTYNPLTVVVAAQSPFKTFKDLVDYMKANPGKTNFATSGKGTQSHLEVEYIKQVLGVSAIDVPYKSTATAMADTLSGQVTFYMTGWAVMQPHVASGKLRALAVGTQQRLPTAAGVPTFIETVGVANYLPAAWFGYAAATGTPPEAVAKLEDGILKAMAAASVREKVQKVSSFLWVQGSREFAADIRAEYEKWGKIVNALGLKN